MPISKAGGGAPVQGRASITMDRVNGDSVRWTWRGVYGDLLSLMDTLAAEPKNTQIVLTPETDGPLGVLEQYRAQTIDDGTPEVPLDTLELNWFDEEISIFFAPRFVPLNSQDRALIHKAINAYHEFGTLPQFTSGPGPEQVSNFQLATEAFVHLERGDDTYKQRVASFSWTRSVSLTYVTGVNQAHIGKIWTGAALQGYIAAQGLLPKLFDIASVNPPTAIPGAFYAAGWMKKEASLNIAANGKGILREQWEYGVWSSSLYPVITSA